MANQEAVQKCIDAGGAAWLSETSPFLGAMNNGETLASWYGSNCEQWVDYLEDINTQIDLYNGYENDQDKRDPDALPPQPLNFALSLIHI